MSRTAQALASRPITASGQNEEPPGPATAEPEGWMDCVSTCWRGRVTLREVVGPFDKVGEVIELVGVDVTCQRVGFFAE